MTITQTTATADRTFEAFSVSHAALLDGTTAAEAADIYGVRTASLAPDTGNSDNTGDDSVMSTWNWLNFAQLTIQSGFLPFEMMAKLAGTPIEVGGTPTAGILKFTPAASGGAGAGDAFDYSAPADIAFSVNGNAVALTTDLTNLAGVVAAVDTALPAGFTVAAEGTRVVVTTTATGAAATITVGGADAAAITGGPAYSNVAGTNGDEISLPLWQEDAANQPPLPVLIRMPGRDARGYTRDVDFILYRVQFGPITFDGPAYKTGLTMSAAGKALLSGYDEVGDPLPKRQIGRIVSRPPA